MISTRKCILNLLVITSFLLGLLPPNVAAHRSISMEADTRSFEALQATNQGMLRFDGTRYDAIDCAGLVLRDARLNRDPKQVETVAVQLYSRLGGDQEGATLTETDINSGLFTLSTQCMQLAAIAGKPGDGSLNVKAGDLIAALVSDASDQTPLVLATAMVAGGKGQGQFNVQIDSQLLPPEMQIDPQNYPLAMVVGNDVPAFFSENQVILRASNQAALDDFLQRRNGTLLNKVQIPLGDPKQGGEQADYFLVQVDPSTFDRSEMPYQMELIGAQGNYTYSSENAARLIAMILEEQLAGNTVLPHALLQYQGRPESNEGTMGLGDGSNIFGEPWFNPEADPTAAVGLGRSTTLLEILDQRQSGEQVRVAIIDGGFAGPGDYPAGSASPNNPDIGDINGDGTVTFNEVPQCAFGPTGSADCSPGSAAGENPLPCSGTGSCPWHGMSMFSVAGAEFDNGFGAAGSGAHAVEPIFLKVGLPYLLPSAAAITRAVEPGMNAKVINMSSGFPCRALLVDACEPLQNSLVTVAFFSLCELIKIAVPVLTDLPCETIHLLLAIPPMASALEGAVNFAEANDVVITSAAGNEVDLLGTRFGPFEPADVKLIPCVLGEVICVGEIVAAGTDLVPSAVSGFGNGVDIWAPGNLTRTVLPNSGGQVVRSNAGAGTSGASAFMAGVVATVRSIHPTLDRSAVRALVLDAGCRTGRAGRFAPEADCTPSSSGRVNAARGGYVDLYQTVRVALDRVGEMDGYLAPCSGGWDSEELAGNDDRASAVSLTVPSVAPGGSEIVEHNGDLSIHSLAPGLPGNFDQDWYKLELPPGFGRGDVVINLTERPGSGNLVINVYQGSSRLAGPAPSGLPLVVRSLWENGDYYIMVTGDPATRDNDNCYGGGTLEIEAFRAPGADAYETNNTVGSAVSLSGWEHGDHWRCTAEGGDRSERGDCSAVFANGFTARSARDLWTTASSELTLHSVTDADFWHLQLPDYQDPAEGGHDDIRSPEESAALGPEPLPECGVVQREDPAPGGLDGTVHVSISSKLIIEVLPTANSLSGRPIGSEPLKLYYRSGDRWVYSETLGRFEGGAMRKVIICPQTDLGDGMPVINELKFSVGERESPRPDLRATGGYDLAVAYRIEAERPHPDWVNEIDAAGESRYVGRIPCFHAGAFGDIGFDGEGLGGFQPAPNVPFCPGDLQNPWSQEMAHPMDAGQLPNCGIDDGGCRETFAMNWPASDSALAFQFTAPPGMSFTLYDENQEQIAKAVPMKQLSTGVGAAAEAPVTMQMNAESLPAGRYYLMVEGTAGAYTLEMTPPAIKVPHTVYLPAMNR